MKQETKQTDARFTFEKKYYIIQGNNGNHTGYNREWKINCEGYDGKREANRVAKEMREENGDIKYGLTPLKIVTPAELIDIYDSQERISFYNCFDITINSCLSLPNEILNNTAGQNLVDAKHKIKTFLNHTENIQL